MRFVCESCRAQYMINDEKVGPKGVKVRCRKCGYVILVKRTDAAKGGPAEQSNDPDDALATQVMQTPLAGADATLSNDDATQLMPSTKDPVAGESFFGADEDEIGAVFDQVLKTGPNPVGAPSLHDSTRVIDGESLRKLAEESGAKEEEKEEAPGEVPQTDWYVAINEKQTGPLTLETIKKHWDDGEISPDSLCWRAGFDDWIPVSTVKALASVLAPKPPKPVIVQQAATFTGGGGQPAVVSVPVQSAFSTGGLVQTVQSEMQVPMSASASNPEPDAGGWKPSAASALASLVKDEMDALSKPPAKAPPPPAEEPEAPVGGGLLDLPMEEKPAPVAPAPRPVAPAAPPVNPYLQNPGATYSAPAVSQYRPPSNNNTQMVAIGAGAIVLLTLVGLVVWLATRQPQQVVVQQPPPTPVVVQQPVQTPTPTPTPVAVPTPVAAAPATEDAGVAAPVAVAAANPPAPTPAQNPLPAPVAVQPKSKSSGSRNSGGSSAKASDPDPEPPPQKNTKQGSGDDFDTLFGDGKKSSAKNEDAPPKKETAKYVPPPPGGGADVKESLENSDIIEGVSSHKPDLASCVQKQKAADPSLSGKLVMKWQIQTNGRTSNISVTSEEFKGTPIAKCIGDLIKTWTFPKHKKQGEPVSFPFKF